ncbi:MULTISPECIES: type II toxin-antitoxin system ParD family antitoxin [Nostocaceae]|jgi:antitoxin ParD1/3/4|uniref:type II toxin-antitoxin system ParD family antitoxin n=1 Tax=Nostocaceae TaxID=1162 RepID=UPI0016820256|nr:MULTISPECIES: type II toxin-antitoxin system ParD family antitoxin [Nostocaceae]MBD2362901.1 type II toxin-antitoxin system ParD family antitoxin [Anabaena minutissima FACHB-250]MEA5564411.1 type II toxin-antitoxin system ParD family antitoxin [Anabaena sp. UHCC 0399]UKO96482.1 type II toxin-antitoxin system ParD family antitoxin [Nostoc sp. UHCC 0870]
MSITLSPEQEQIIQVLLATGRFHSVDEVIKSALRLLEEETISNQGWLEETRTKIDEGIASLERGEGIDGETFVNQLLTQLQQAKKAEK